MNNQIKYSVCIVLFLLLSVVAIRNNTHAHKTTQHTEYQSIISQQTTNQKAALELLHIHSVSTVSENITFDHQSHELKFHSKSSGKHYSRHEQISHLGNYHYQYLHPDLIEYYIYQLNKIII